MRVLDRFLLLVSNILDDPSLTALLTVGGAAAASAPAGRTASISISSVDSYSHTDGDGDGDTDTADDGGQDADEVDLNSTGGSQAYGQLADNVRSTLTSQDGRALGSAAVGGSSSSGRLKLQRPSQTAAVEPSGPAPYSRAIQLPLKQNAPRAASSGAGAADAQSHVRAVCIMMRGIVTAPILILMFVLLLWIMLMYWSPVHSYPRYSSSLRLYRSSLSRPQWHW